MEWENPILSTGLVSLGELLAPIPDGLYPVSRYEPDPDKCLELIEIRSRLYVNLMAEAIRRAKKCYNEAIDAAPPEELANLLADDNGEKLWLKFRDRHVNGVNDTMEFPRVVSQTKKEMGFSDLYWDGILY